MEVKIGYAWKLNPTGLNRRIYVREVVDSKARKVRRKHVQEYGELVKVI